MRPLYAFFIFLSQILVLPWLVTSTPAKDFGEIEQPPTFSLENLPAWTDHLQQQFSLHDVPRDMQTEVGINFLESEKELQAVMDVRRKYYLKHSGEKCWDWEGFVQDLKNVTAIADSQKNPKNPLDPIDQKISEFVEAAKKFENSTILPALKQIAEGAGTFSDDMKPAIDEAVHTLEDFWTHKVVPAAEDAGHAIGGFFDKFVHPSPAKDADDSTPALDSVSPSQGDSSPNPDLEEVKAAWAEFLKAGQGLVSSVGDSVNTYLIQHVAPILKDIERLAKQARDSIDVFRAQHPFVAASIGAVLVVAGASVIIPAVGAVLLEVAGINALGPVAGSLAASIQSSVYGAWTTGVFSALQHFAMTYVSVSVFELVAAGSVAAAGLYLLSSLWADPPNYTDPTSSSAPDDLIPILQAWDPPMTFTGNNPNQDVMMWFGDIERACAERGIPQERWRDVAMYFFHVDMVEIV